MNILLGICGGIAAYKCAELTRLLRKQNVNVRVVMTRAALQFISPLTFQALTGERVYSQLFDDDSQSAMEHIELARWANAIIIAPATANSLAKYAHGFADDLLSTLYLAATCPVYIAPAMNQAMWHKAVTQNNIAKLRADGVHIIEPQAGEQACGEIGLGRLAEPETICQILLSELNTTPCLQGLKVLISAGATREALDPVRYLTNRSSGKMGYALATAAKQAGAQVTLVSGVVNLSPPAEVNLINVESAAQMYQAVLAHAPYHDIYIGAAAVADYSPVAQVEKIKKHSEQITLVLQKNADILAAVAQLGNVFTVGFAAETEKLEQYALDKLHRKKLDMIAANWVGQAQGGFESDQNALQVYWQTGSQHLAMTTKTQLAQQFISLIAQQYHQKHEQHTA